jgi:Ca-activated chloride channel family protein
MTFAKPEMLWLLAVTAPLLAWFLVWSWRKRRALIRQFVQSRLLAQLTVGVSPWRQKLRLALAGVAALLLLLALARPQYGYAWEEVRQRGLDIVVALDTSRSMLAADVAPDRLTRAKLAALDLQRLARTDRLALVAFAGTAFLQCPLTLDDNAFQQSLNLLTVDFLPQGGTALGEAIEVGLTAFKDSGSNHRVLVIFSDGEDHDSDAPAAAARAAERGVKIFTVGVGTFTGDRLRLVDAQGRTTYVTDERNQPVVSRLNADLLREIARKTGGDYLPLIGADPMKTLYDARLASLPKSDLSSRWSRQYHERFQWPLGLAILLLVLEMFLPERRRVERAEPGGTATAAAAAGLKRALSALALLLWAAPALASAGGALRDYERGRYHAAEQEYRRLLERQPDDARLHFNAGTAAYAAGEYASATNHLEAATRTSDPDLLQRAYYNLGNALFRLGEAAEAPGLILTNWQQAVQHYDSALRLNPHDRDAEFNRGFVQTRIEELLRQLAQPQQQQSGQKQPQQSQSSETAEQPPPPQPKPQPKPPDSKQGSQPKPSPEEQRQNESPLDTSAPRQPEQPKPDSQPGRQGGEPKPEEKAGKDQPAPQSAGGQEGQSTNATAAAAATMTAPGQMSREQARQLLEAARLDEKAWQPLPPRDPRKVNRNYRDW